MNSLLLNNFSSLTDSSFLSAEIVIIFLSTLILKSDLDNPGAANSIRKAFSVSEILTAGTREINRSEIKESLNKLSNTVLTNGFTESVFKLFVGNLINAIFLSSF
ncbi:hypothetical protein D9M71_724300 [compost metagenome]